MEQKVLDKKINGRALVAFLILAVVVFLIIARLFYLQIVQHDYYNALVAGEVMGRNTIKATRGIIYDANGNELATNITTYSVCLSPHDIYAYSNTQISNGKQVDPTKYSWTSKDGVTKENLLASQVIAYELGEVLGSDYDTLMKASEKEASYYYLVSKNVSEETVEILREFNQKYKFSNLLYFQAESTRYYPYGTLACHVIGFLNSEGEGLYGLESYYNNLLEGTQGKYVYAKDAKNNEIPSKYETYINSENGYNITTTIDVYLQSVLEDVLAQTSEKYNPTNRATGIVMNPKTGAVYAMATYPSYDCNNPYEMSEYFNFILDKYDEDSEEYSKAYAECLFSMWNNKAISDTYEPGSTFKPITASMALEDEVVDLSDEFTCTGSYLIEGWNSPIACHKLDGHGTVTFAVGLQQSCNPTLMQVALRMGPEKFYNFFTYFGYADKTGIDLPAEAKTLYTDYKDFGAVSLAVYSFGQTFRTTPIQQLTALSAIANGGYLVTPHVLDKVVDQDGNTVYEYEEEVKRQIISKETSTILMNVLEEGVSGNGGAKNAYVKGYKVAAKTGTSEKKDKYDENGNTPYRISSCVGIAPSDDAQIAVIIIVDEPSTGSVYGSVVAAPYVSAFLARALPYLGIEPQYSEDNVDEYEVNVADYVGSGLNLVKNDLSYRGINYVIIGNGSTVVEQSPKAGESIIKSTGTIYLYTDSNSYRQEVEIPDVTGLTNSEARKLLNNIGINVTLEGATNSGVATVVEQSVAPGTMLQKGKVVKLVLRHFDFTE